MVKFLFVQRLYNLSDEQTEYQINDRMSFRRFPDIPFSDAVPDCKTVRAFREQLKDNGRTEAIFAAFIGQPEAKNLIAKEGKMVDATIVSVPVQRNSGDDNKTIKEGQVPESFSAHPATGRQKDTDARWTKKHNKSYFGYKNHIKADRKNKFILCLRRNRCIGARQPALPGPVERIRPGRSLLCRQRLSERRH